jgi:hypothetical protein
MRHKYPSSSLSGLSRSLNAARPCPPFASPRIKIFSSPVAIQDSSRRKTVIVVGRSLPSKGGWSAGRTARPRWRPRPCSLRTAVSIVPSHHPRAENLKADSVSHASAKSWCCSPPCSSFVALVVPAGLGSCMKGESREIRSARGLCFRLFCVKLRIQFRFNGAYARVDQWIPVVVQGEERWTGCVLAAAVLDVRLFSSYEEERGGGRTSASARISGLPAAIARSPAVTVSDRSSCAS